MATARLVRKNLMLDAGQLRELAERRKQSESATVRELVTHALAAEGVGEILVALQEAGGIDDVFGKLEVSEVGSSGPAPTSTTIR
jgi:hypothetical protein